MLADGTNTYRYGNGRLAQYQTAMQYFGADGLGSARQLYDASGLVLANTRYDPYGNLMSQYGSATSVFAFTGEQWDAATGLEYLRARYYSSAVARFVQPDSIIPNPYNPQSLNRYSYTLNNPVRYTDPTGQCIPEECGNAYGDVDNIYVDPNASIGPPATSGGQQLPDSGATGTGKGQQQTQCQDPSGCIGAKPPSQAKKNKVPQGMPNGRVRSFGFMAGVLYFYVDISLDAVTQIESGETWIYLTTPDKSYACQGGILCSGDWASPQVSFGYQEGSVWNLDEPGDYAGPFHVTNESAVFWSVQRFYSPDGSVYGVMGGPAWTPSRITLPFVSGFDIHTWSQPILPFVR